MSTDYKIYCRHGILLFFMVFKFVFLLIPLGVLTWIFYEYQYIFSPEFSNYILLPTLLITVNYLIVQIILNIIDFYGRIMLVSHESIILSHTSLILIDDIEFLNIKSVLKVDVEKHWLLASILNYGHLILEQRNDIRRVHYLWDPYRIYQMIKTHIPAQVMTNTEN